MRWLVRLIAGLCCVVILYLSAAFIGAFVPGRTASVVVGDDVTIKLIAGPIHYDLLLPATPETRQAFGFLNEFGVPVETSDWIVVGWGSQAFYTATGGYQDLDIGPIFRAVTGDSAVFRFDAISADLTGFGDAVPMSNAQYAQLRGQILQGVMRDETAGVMPIAGAGFTATDVFLEARGRFSILRTCNVWVGEVLRGAGVKMGAWTPTPYAVTLSRWWFG